MRVVRLLGVLLLSFPVPAAAEATGALLGRLEAARALVDPVDRAAGLAAVYFEARDFGAVLGAAEAGLEHDPDRLELVWRAAAAELWLQDGRSALVWTDRLRSTAQRLELEPEARRSWLAAADEFEARADELAAIQAESEAALVRARLTVGGVGLGTTLVILVLVATRR